MTLTPKEEAAILKMREEEALARAETEVTREKIVRAEGRLRDFLIPQSRNTVGWAPEYLAIILQELVYLREKVEELQESSNRFSVLPVLMAPVESEETPHPSKTPAPAPPLPEQPPPSPGE